MPRLSVSSKLVLVAMLSAIVAGPLTAQRVSSATAAAPVQAAGNSGIGIKLTPADECPGCPPQHLGAAMVETFMLNMYIATFNRFVRNEPFTALSPETWQHNLEEGFEWDDNDFSTNHWAHPYHGSTYFNAGRSNGFDFWESTPFAAAGSFMWEYFGESHRPSFNDFIYTTTGGIALGEMLYRFSAMITDNEATGSSRTWREIAGTLVNPIRGLNRLMSGRVVQVRPNPPEHQPEKLGIFMEAGVRRVSEQGQREDQAHPFFLFEFDHNKPMLRDHQKPYDWFRFLIQVNTSDEKKLGRAQVRGGLYMAPIEPGEGTRHRFSVVQDFDYFNNDVFEFGRTAITVGYYSNWRLGERLSLNTMAGVDGVLLGAVNSEFVGVQDRTYDYGPGVGIALGASLTGASGFRYVELAYNPNFIHSVSGADANHVVQMGYVDASIPVWRNLGVGLSGLYYNRSSNFVQFGRITDDVSELRAHITWSIQ